MGDTSVTSAQSELFPSTSDNLLDHPSAFQPHRKLKIVTVGAGFSALIFAHKLQHERPEFQTLVEHKIFESRHDIGGTWLVNRYPGVQCDVPAHVYVYFLHVLRAISDVERHSPSIPILIGVISMLLGRRFMRTSRRRPKSGIWTEMYTSTTKSLKQSGKTTLASGELW